MTENHGKMGCMIKDIRIHNYKLSVKFWPKSLLKRIFKGLLGGKIMQGSKKTIQIKTKSSIKKLQKNKIPNLIKNIQMFLI